MQGLFHRVTIVIDTDDNKKFSELLRFVLGLQKILAPDVELDYAVEPSEVLMAREETQDDELPF